MFTQDVDPAEAGRGIDECGHVALAGHRHGVRTALDRVVDGIIEDYGEAVDRLAEL